MLSWLYDLLSDFFCSDFFDFLVAMFKGILFLTLICLPFGLMGVGFYRQSYALLVLGVIVFFVEVGSALGVLIEELRWK